MKLQFKDDGQISNALLHLINYEVSAHFSFTFSLFLLILEHRILKMEIFEQYQIYVCAHLYF